MVKWTDDVHALDIELRVLPVFIHSSFSHFLRPKPMWQLSQNFIRSKISNCLTYLVRPRPVSSSRLPSLCQAVDFFLLNCSVSLLFLITSSKYLIKIIFRMKDLFHSCFTERVPGIRGALAGAWSLWLDMYISAGQERETQSGSRGGLLSKRFHGIPKQHHHWVSQKPLRLWTFKPAHNFYKPFLSPFCLVPSGFKFATVLPGVMSTSQDSRNNEGTKGVRSVKCVPFYPGHKKFPGSHSQWSPHHITLPNLEEI